MAPLASTTGCDLRMATCLVLAPEDGYLLRGVTWRWLPTTWYDVLAPEDGSLREGGRVLVVQGELHLARVRLRLRLRLRVLGC